MGEELTLRYKKTNEQPRFAFIVSVSIDKRATQRNRMRRLLSESVRHLRPRIAQIDATLVARRTIGKVLQTEVEIMVIDLLHKARLLSP